MQDIHGVEADPEWLVPLQHLLPVDKGSKQHLFLMD